MTDADAAVVTTKRRKVVLIAVLIVILTAVAVTVGVIVGGNKNREMERDQAAAAAASTTAGSSSSSTNVGGSSTNDDKDEFSPTSSPTNLEAASSASTPTIAPNTTTTIVTDAPSIATPVPPPQTDAPTTALSPMTTATTPVWSNPGEIVSGTILGGTMDYLRCANNAAVTKQVVLLHGSSFTKEVWESDDMLTKFCGGAQIVVALDFPVSTDYQGLIQVLEALQLPTDEEPVPLISLPVTLVTPSASGFAMVSWIMSDDADTELSRIPSFVVEWVPVATGSLVSASDEQIAALQRLSPDFRILAINGNNDRAGGKYSARLADLAKATAVELVGRHAVYLQSPDEFVQTILEF